MAVSIISNRPGTSVVIHATPANSTLVITGNSSVSNIASPGETLAGAYITQAAWGCAPGAVITIKRDDTPVAFYDSTGQHEYAGAGMPINIGQSAANLTIEFANSDNCFIVFELQKVGVFPSEYLQS
jgi:hypothetical protein